MRHLTVSLSVLLIIASCSCCSSVEMLLIDWCALQSVVQLS